MQKLIIREETNDLNEPILIDRDRMVEVEGRDGHIQAEGSNLCHVRTSYEFIGKAIYLNGSFDWVFGKDSDGVACAVPLKKLSSDK